MTSNKSTSNLQQKQVLATQKNYYASKSGKQIVLHEREAGFKFMTSVYI
jgi:hypothetical protein